MKAYLRGLADEFGESTNSIRLELNHLEEAGLLKSESDGNKKVYQANPEHPLFHDIRSLVLKHSGITQIIDQVVEKTGDIEKVWVKGDFAQGKDSDVVDLIILGNRINVEYFNSLIKKVENLIKRNIRYVIIPSESEAQMNCVGEKNLLIWKK
ncbi:MAG: winged helix-turn-helix domain-containing protein [Oscillibacter sp.]|nr:winged helix-turn-helix domain-containing protein [Oscillibacter sp.]